ncbi:hypothetical protein TCAL_14668 [Tigriopus californicus]|uniref:Talin central domain-containing protein n=1 Tax=Tigriopus californicus TaxID=6832 RepID=A0A553NQZ0_TIGCA|nr:hypothetical protein TCAL_14668 [Tigriopus californicus]
MDAVAEADCEAAAKAVLNIAELTANPDAPRRRERALDAAACARAAAVAARKIADASPTSQAQRRARIAENCANAAELQASLL